MPRRAHDEIDGSAGRSEFPLHVAQFLIDRAPRPTHNRPQGLRPHAHYDTDLHYVAERRNLRPLDGVSPLANRGLPVLWAYPAEDFQYANQNRDGRLRGQGPPGPHRIITDRDKRIIGMSTHPLGRQREFVRAPARVQVMRR